MKKLAVASTLLCLVAGSAFAGGYAEPIVEAEPVVVEETGSSSNGWLIGGLLLLALVAVAASSNSSSGT